MKENQYLRADGEMSFVLPQEARGHGSAGSFQRALFNELGPRPVPALPCPTTNSGGPAHLSGSRPLTSISLQTGQLVFACPAPISPVLVVTPQFFLGIPVQEATCTHLPN